MIRLILRDLFPGRSAVGVLRQRVHELEREIVYLRDERDGAIAVLTLRESEIATLQKRALRPDPTPGEARMLEIVRANPGLLTAQLCDLARPGTIAVELEKYRREYGEPPANSWLLTVAQTRSEDEAQYLTGLHKKSLVRRDRSGNTYRYWVSE